MPVQASRKAHEWPVKEKVLEHRQGQQSRAHASTASHTGHRTDTGGGYSHGAGGDG